MASRFRPSSIVNNKLTLILRLFFLSTAANIQVASSQISISDIEIGALSDLYISTEGWNWNWNTSSSAAPLWRFNSTNQQDPCADDSKVNIGISAWQGIQCNFSPTACYTDGAICSVIGIFLPEYGVSIMFLINVSIASNSLTVYLYIHFFLTFLC